MTHLGSLLTKTLTVNAALQRVLPRFSRHARRRDIFLASVGFSLLGYAVDLLALHRQGGRRTALADAGLAVLTLAWARRLLPGFRLGLPGLLAGALAVAANELWFHDLLQERRPVPSTARSGARRPDARS